MNEFVADSEHRRVCAGKGIMRQLHRIKRAAAKTALQSSEQVFEVAGASGVP